MSARVFVLALLLGGCHATTSLEAPEIPPGTGSMLLIAKGPDYELAFALDVPSDGSTPQLPTITRPPEIDLYSVHFACGLSTLGIQPGRQSLTTESERLELPAPRAVFTSQDGATQTEWTESDLDAVESTLRALPLPDRNMCRLYGVNFGNVQATFLVGSQTSTPSAILPLENGNALVANTDGTFWEVDAERHERQLPIMPGAPNDAGFLTSDGTVWLVDEDGTLAHGDPNLGGFEVIEAVGSTISPAAIVDGADYGPPEVFRTGFNRIWERWDGTTWTQIADARDTLMPLTGNYSTVWLGPGHALATGVIENQNNALRYRDGELEVEQMPDGENPTTVTQLPGFGVLIGTSNGLIIREEEDGGWAIEDGSHIDSSIRNIVPTEDGFLYGRTSWGSWDPVAGYCRVDVPSSDGARVVPLGDRAFLLLGGLILGRGSYLSTLDRIEVDDPCLGK